VRLIKITVPGLLVSTVKLAVDSLGYFPIFHKLALQNYRVLNLYSLNGVKRVANAKVSILRAGIFTVF